MSNILTKSLFRQTLRTVTPLKRCFSASVSRHLQRYEDSDLSNKKIEDIIADFEKPLIDPNQLQDESADPRTVLVSSIENFRPKRKLVLSEKQMTGLESQINIAYTVDQLRTILRAAQAHNPSLELRRLKTLKKAQLVKAITETLWGLKTEEQVKEEMKRKKLDTVKQSFPASRQELFFIIGDNGNTMRKIEQENDVKVTIDVSSNQYIVEGLAGAVTKVKQKIKSHLDIKEETMEVKCQLDQETRDEIEDALVDVSKVAGTFITLKDDKFYLASVSNESMDNAKRLLSLMLADLQKTTEARTTLVSNNYAEFTVLPLHDSRSMSLYNRKLNWNRLTITNKAKQDTGEETFKILENGQDIGGLENIKDLLLEPFRQETAADTSNISMEARFGNIFFQTPRNGGSYTTTNTIKSTIELLDLYKNRRIFFNTMPPRQLTCSFIPFLLDGGFHERTVRVDYLNKSLLSQQPNNSLNEKEMKKLTVEFSMNEQGDISLKNIMGIRNQSIMDILGVYGNVDIRLLANQFIDFSNQQEIKDLLLDQCQLTSYTELQAPKSLQGQNMILQDITFSNKKKYLLDDKSSLVCINHIEQQDKRVKRTELVLNSIDPDTLSISNSVLRWSSFSSALKRVAEKWDYST